MRQLLINIDVDDVNQAVSFYTAAFGVKVGRRFDPGFVELVGLAAPLYLLDKKSSTTPFPGARQLRNYERHWTPIHLDVVVDDMTESFARVVAAGARSESEVIEEAYGRLAFFSDPFGHGFCLIEWKGQGYDELLQHPL